MTQQLQQILDAAWDDRANISATSASAEVRDAVNHVISQLNNGSLRVAISWGEPNVGGVTEVYRLVEEAGTLECLSTVAVAAGSVTTRSVFRRSDRWKPRFSWNPLMGIRG